VDPQRPVEPPGAAGGPGVRVLERPVRLSQSAIWRLQRDYFEERGVRAWASGDVPHAATNNPALARSYVQVFEGLAADAAAGHFGDFDPHEPLYVIELGAGSGGFAYHFLSALDPDVLPARPVYVLTDLAASNLHFWRDHPKLAPFVRSGLLDMALFDAVADEAMRLEHRGGELRTGTVANPLVVVANYFFDVLPQDLFVSSGGELFEERVALALPEDVEVTDGDVFRAVSMTTERHPAEAGAYYGDPDLDGALAALAAVRGRRHPGRFLFPVVALEMLQNLRRLAGGRLLVLTHERPGSVQDLAMTLVAQAGHDPSDPAAVEEVLRRHEVAVVGQEPATATRAPVLTGLSVHGRSFSLMVEQDAFAAAALEWGGELLVPHARPTRTAVSALVTGATGPYPHTRRRFALAFEEGSPEERYHALFGVPKFRPGDAETTEAAPGAGVGGSDALPDDERVPPEELSWLLALLRICGYDTEVLGDLYPLLNDAIESAPGVVVDDLVDALRTVCDRHFPIGGKSDPALAAAALLAPNGRYTEALEFLARSVEQRGPQAQVSYNTALCHLRLGDLPAALAAADEALSFAEPSAAAQQLRAAVVEEMESAGRT
jgi:hypothetical protein